MLGISKTIPILAMIAAGTAHGDLLSADVSIGGGSILDADVSVGHGKVASASATVGGGSVADVNASVGGGRTATASVGIGGGHQSGGTGGSSGGSSGGTAMAGGSASTGIGSGRSGGAVIATSGRASGGGIGMAGAVRNLSLYSSDGVRLGTILSMERAGSLVRVTLALDPALGHGTSRMTFRASVSQRTKTQFALGQSARAFVSLL